MDFFRQHRIIWQKVSARDFSSRQGLETQEGFVPFKFPNRGIGGKDPARLAANLCGVAFSINENCSFAKRKIARLFAEIAFFPPPCYNGVELQAGKEAPLWKDAKR